MIPSVSGGWRRVRLSLQATCGSDAGRREMLVDGQSFGHGHTIAVAAAQATMLTKGVQFRAG
jgi:hypothetical protein